MSRRETGVSFCAIAAFLFATQYIAAALYDGDPSSWSHGAFQDLLRYIGDAPGNLAFVSLVVGIIYLVIAERSEHRVS